MLLGHVICYDRFFTEQNNKPHQSALQMVIFLHSASVFYISNITGIHLRIGTPSTHLSGYNGATGERNCTSLLAGVSLTAVKVDVPGPVSIVVPATASKLGVWTGDEIVGMLLLDQVFTLKMHFLNVSLL